MKIVSCEKHHYYYLEVHGAGWGHWTNFRRNGPYNWEVAMGESWEGVNDCDDLEAAFIEFNS